MEQLIAEFTKLVEERINSLKDSVSAGMLPNMEEYKKSTGHILGLREALDLIERSKTNVLER